MLYLLMLAGGTFWRRQWIDELRATAPRDVALHLAAGLAAGLGLVVLLRLLRFLRPMQVLEDELARLLGAVDARIAFYLALFSGIGEEALFRGAMQNAWGLHLTCAIFGAVHVLNRRTWYWMVLAWGMGYVLGGLYLATGNLLAPVACHFAINFVNLQLIGVRARELGYQ